MNPPTATGHRSSVALFDLDDTLLDGDSDVLWFEWLHDQGLIDAGPLERMERIYERYREGADDAADFIELQTLGIAGWPVSRLTQACRRFFVEVLSPRLVPAGYRAVREHRAIGIRAVLLTAVMEPRLDPLIEAWGFDGALGTTLEVVGGHIGETIIPPYCFRAGKAEKLREYARTQHVDLAASTFYGDSINDLPALEMVGHPRPVDPDPLLRAEAETRGWEIVSWR